MNEKLTDITFLVDRSGSMQSVWSDVVGGLEGFIEEQRKAPGDANFTLILFDSSNPHEVLIDAQNVNDVKIDLSGHLPRDMTPLRDAMLKAINATGERLAAMPEDQRPGQVIFVSYTDGHENASREISAVDLKKLVEQQQKDYNWQFLFLGADIDAIGEGGSVGVQQINAINVNKGVKTAGVMRGISAKIGSYREQPTNSGLLQFSAQERQAYASADAGEDPVAASRAASEAAKEPEPSDVS